MIGDRLASDIRLGRVGYGSLVDYRVGCSVGLTRRIVQLAVDVLGVQR